MEEGEAALNGVAGEELFTFFNRVNGINDLSCLGFSLED